MPDSPFILNTPPDIEDIPNLPRVEKSSKMQSVHRHFGKYMKRSADETQVAVLLKDFEEADKLLTRVRFLKLCLRPDCPSKRLHVGKLINSVPDH